MPQNTPQKQQNTPFRFKGWLILLTLILFLAILIFLVNLKGAEVKAQRSAQRRTGPPPVNVVTLTLSPTAISDKVTLPAEVLAMKRLDLPAEVNATFLEKSVGEGDPVQSGQVIARLDTDRYSARVDAARSSLSQALATRKRMESLNRSRLATDADVEGAITAHEQAKSALVTAEIDLARCTIKAPFTGFLDSYDVEEGAFITTGTPICSLLDLSKIKVRVGIPEADIVEAASPDAFRVYIPSIGSAPLEGGEILRLSKKAGNMAKLFDMDLLFENPDYRILPDMFARVELVKKHHEGALVVPLYAVITRDKEQFLFVVENNQARMKRISTGIQEGWMVEITQGVREGDQVIVTGQRSVNDGRDVTVVKELSRVEEILP